MYSTDDYEVSLSNTNNFLENVWFQVFLSNANNYIFSRNYFYLIRVICLHSYIVTSSYR